MFRPFVQSARCAMRASQTSRVASIRPSAASFVRSAKPSLAPSLAISGRRHYASSGSLSQKEVEGRIMDLLKGFDKVQEPTKLSATSHFSNDLGLDSLDTVEVVMAIEEEFSIEIPDKEADAIHSVDKAVSYILSQPDAH